MREFGIPGRWPVRVRRSLVSEATDVLTRLYASFIATISAKEDSANFLNEEVGCLTGSNYEKIYATPTSGLQ